MTSPRQFPRLTLGRLMIAVAILAVLFAALQYDVGMRGYLIFLAAFVGFIASSLSASRLQGKARFAALTVASLCIVLGFGAFYWLGVR